MLADMNLFVLLLCLSFTVIAVHGKDGKTWALLVASARGWGNYGMQSDVYHAYQVIRQGGIPEDQIVVMAYDDIANSERNPFKGQVFQSYDLKDIYEGLVVDYKEKDVTKEVFTAVLSGDKDAVKKLTGRAGKVIDSGPDDNVFVQIDDHGKPGYVSWWDDNDLSARELNDTIARMHKQNRYKNLVVYIDTCFAGSMFENVLSDKIRVYAATATNANSVAWNADCNSKAFRRLSRPCLGGLFSINWVYELLSDERTQSTMDMQFQQAKIACKGQSSPRQYGDLSIAKKMQSEFFGDSAVNTKPVQNKRSRRSIDEQSIMPKHLMVYNTLKNQLAALPEGSREYQSIAVELSRVETLMGHVDQFIKDVSRAVHGRFATDKYLAWAERNFGPINWSCYEPVVEAVRSQCPGMMRAEEVKYYAGSKFGVLINVCNEVRTEMLIGAVKAAARVNPMCDV